MIIVITLIKKHYLCIEFQREQRGNEDEGNTEANHISRRKSPPDQTRLEA